MHSSIVLYSFIEIFILLQQKRMFSCVPSTLYPPPFPWLGQWHGHCVSEASRWSRCSAQFLFINSRQNAMSAPCSPQGIFLFPYFVCGRSTFASCRCFGLLSSGSHTSKSLFFPLVSQILSAGEAPFHSVGILVSCQVAHIPIKSFFSLLSYQ